MITLTSKLLWQEEYPQIKLLNEFSIIENLASEAVRHDLSFQEEVIEMIPKNAIAIMERDFAS